MAQTPHEWKFRTKRERQRLNPYSRPQNDRIVDSNHSKDNNDHSIMKRFKNLLLPNWLKSTANFLTSRSDNNSSNTDNNVVEVESNVESIELPQHSSVISCPNILSSKPLTRSALNADTSAPNVANSRLLSIASTSSTLYPIGQLIESTESCERESEQQQRLQTLSQSNDAVDVDDGSSETDATASSTSGCSSLVPSHSDNVLRLGLNLETMRKEMERTKARNTSESIVKRNLMNSECKPQPITSSKRFNVSSFMSSSSILSQQSHFYKGKTSFGGSNNYNFNRVSRLSGTSPYSLSSRHTLAPYMKIQANQSKPLESNAELSSTTKKIFEKLEKASTPLQDVKRIPVYNLNSTNSSLGYQQLSRSNKRMRCGPPIASILTPNKAIIDTRNKPIKWELSQVKINEDISKRKSTLLIGNENKKADSLSAESYEISDNRVNLRDGGGKITNKNNKHIKNDETANEKDNVNLKSVGLPFPDGVSLPKFDFSYSALNQSKKSTPTTVLTKVDDNSKFKFSSPVLKKNETNIEITRNSQSNDSQFTFSSPANTHMPDKRNDLSNTKQSVKTEAKDKYYKSINQSMLPSKESENKSEAIKNCDNDKAMWTCRCLFRNKPEYNKCCSCNAERGSTKTDAISKPVVATDSLADMFKRPTGSWNCPSCLTNMSSDKSECACCGELKPGLNNSTNNSENTTLSDSWQCFHCKRNNVSSTTNCEGCKQVKKVVATKADLDKLYSSQSFKFDASKFSKDIPDSKIKDNLISKQSNDKTQSLSGTAAGFNFFPSVTTANTSVTTVFSDAITTTKESFKFGLPKSFDSKLETTSKESPNTNNVSISTSNANLFKFGTSPVSTVSSFANQPPNEDFKTNQSVDSEKEKSDVSNKKEMRTDSVKQTEVKTASFSFGSINSGIGSTFDGTSFGSTNLKNMPFESKPTSDTVVKPKEESSSKKVSSFVSSFPISSDSSSLSTTNLFNSGSNADSSTKSLFTFGSTNKQKPALTTSSSISTPSFTLPIISNPLFATASTTIATTSTTKPTITTTTTTSTTTAPQNKIVFGELNKTSTELSSTNLNAVSKSNFFFTPTLSTTNPNQETSFRSNNLFGSAPNKAFSFGNTPLNSSQTGFTFNAISTNASTVSAVAPASTISFGSQNVDDSNNVKTTTASLFTFGNKTAETFGVPSLNPKANTSTQFNFGATQATTAQANTTSIFTNPANSSNPQNTNNNTSIFSNPLNATNSQNNTSIFSNPSSATNPQNRMAFSANSAPNPANSGYNFSLTNPMMPSMPSLPLQQQIPQQPNFNFSQTPTFDFGRGVGNTANQPVFQFSAEQTNTNQPASRNFKKAKRRLNNPT